MSRIVFLCFKCGLMEEEAFGYHVQAYGGDTCPHDGVEHVVAPISEAEEWWAYHDPRRGGDLHTQTWLSVSRDYFDLDAPRRVFVIPTPEVSA